MKAWKNFTVKFAAKLLLKVEIFAVFKFFKNPPSYVVTAIVLLSSPVFRGARSREGAMAHDMRRFYLALSTERGLTDFF